MDSLLETWEEFREQSTKVQIIAGIVAAILVFCAIGLPLLIRPSSDFDEIVESCGGEMTDDQRLRLLKDHNRYRSRVAKGNYKIKAESSAFKVLPPATRMIQLKYNCSLEKSALAWGRRIQCALVHSQGDVGENLWASTGKVSFSRASKEPTRPWADEVEKFGVVADINEWTHDIGHATQIFWDDTATVGCGIIHCDNGGTSVTCHYYPPGNFMGQKWYKAGKTLSDCGKAKKNEDADVVDSREVGHPSTGLCELTT